MCEKVLFRLQAVVLIVSGSLLFVGCPWNSDSDSDPVSTSQGVTTGNILAVDADGHFLVDVVYDSSWEKSMYRADGTYELLEYSLSGGQRVLSDGRRGTYSWDVGSKVTTWHITSTYDGSNWVFADYTDRFEQAFFDHQFGYCNVLQDDGTWGHNFRRTDSSGDLVTDYSFYENIDMDLMTQSFTIDSLEYDTSGDLTAESYRERVNRTIENIYPTGAVFAPGQSITVTMFDTLSQKQTYDGTSWSGWVDQTPQQWVVRYAHFGTFTYGIDTYSARSITTTFTAP